MDIPIEQVRKLGETLKLYSKQQNYPHPDEQAAQREELEWDAPHFYAEVLLQAEEGEFFLVDRDMLIKLQQRYNEHTGSGIDVTCLINDGWLRIVYQNVRIPTVICEAARTVEKLKELKAELTFLICVQKNKRKNAEISAEEFHRLVADYESKHGLKLDLRATASQNLWQEKDGFIHLQNVNYYEPLLPHWSSALFIHFVYEHLHHKEHENDLRIERSKLQTIVSRYSQLFPKTPTLEDFVAAGRLWHQGNYYTVLFAQRHYFLDKTAAVLWERLLTDGRFSDDAARLAFWYNRIVHRSPAWPDIGAFICGDSLARFIAAALNAVIADSDLSNGQEEYRKLLLDPTHERLHRLAYLPIALSKDVFPTQTDFYELYWHLRALDKDFQGELLYYQTARLPLAYFIRQIAQYAAEHNTGVLSPAMSQLIEAGAKKPY